jgi:regulator of protease activity HflC (stomatin/prohibitin superfamily)
MTWIILTILFAIVGGISLLVWLFGDKAPEGSDEISPKAWGGIATVTIGVIWLVMTLFMSATQISAGHVGVKYQFGKIVGTVPSGLHVVAPWINVVSANTQVQSHTFDNLTSFSKETQDVNVTATLNYSVNPSDVKNLYTTVGSDWFDKLVATRVNQFFKDETVKFTAVEIAPHRDQIRKDVRSVLRSALAPYSVNVEDLLIDNISFSPAFTNAIQDKQIATQQALAAQNRVATAKYKAQQIIEQAQGQAKANLLKRQTLTPLLVEQNAIDKLNPNVSVIVVPSGANFILPGLAAAAAASTPTAPTKKP